MQGNQSLLKIGKAAFCGAAIALLSGGLALGVTDTQFRYSTPKPGSFSISFAALAKDSSSAGSFQMNFDGGYIVESPGGSDCFGTGVNLPQAAVITQVRVWMASTHAGGTTVRLFRNQLSNGAVSNIAAQDGLFTDTNGIRRAASIPVTPALATVSNTAFSYGMLICLNQEDKFYAARIDYLYSLAGD